MKHCRGGITSVPGFEANGLYCGIKKSRKKDLALIYSSAPCVAAGVFTDNRLTASCIPFNKAQLRKRTARAIIVNSGNANCLTGKIGVKHTSLIAQAASKALKIHQDQVFVGATGVIGEILPIQKILKSIPRLVHGLNRSSGLSCANAILTTDRLPKESACEIVIRGKKIRFGAIAKGAGMIHPHMTNGFSRHATMLCYVATNAAMDKKTLQYALNEAVQNTFNLITVDGDKSTNDMVLILSNGLAKNLEIKGRGKEYKLVFDALLYLFNDLSHQMILDAEGATKLLTVHVTGARNLEDARRAARSITSSTLVKTALFGSDPNWGRIAASVGSSGASVNVNRLMISLGSQKVFLNGEPQRVALKRLHQSFCQKQISITVDLGVGRQSSKAWTCDLSTDYVRINSSYRT
jgi:glutamate N-acetyltransferase / amino-acid N-acetyltransferase